MRRFLPPTFLAVAAILFVMSPLAKGATAGGTCPSGVPSGITSCYYIAANGVDSASGTSEASPWLHAPGMPNCSAACSAVTPAPGNGFIFHGGDTWGAASFTWEWPAGGSSSSARVYLGVDQAWYNTGTCGGAWCRPIMDCQGSCSRQLQFASGVNFAQIDNFEWRGLFDNSSNPAFNEVFSVDVHNGIQGNSAADIILSNNYFHGATIYHDGTQNSVFVQWATSTDTHSQAYGNVWDNSDGGGNAPNVMMCIDGNVAYTYQNICRYIANGFVQAGGTSFHDNLIEYLYVSVDASTHSNGFESNADCGLIAYGNIFRHVEQAGLVEFQLAPNSGCTSYAFDNLMYDTVASNGMQCYEGASGGTCQFFNNTAQCGAAGNSSIPCGRATGNDPGVWTNNHFITSASPVIAGGSVTLTTNVTQTEPNANGQGYTAAQPYVFFPMAQSDATVSAGTGLTSLCSTIGGRDTAAGSACTNDTTYAITYNSSNHTVSFPARATNARPGGSAAWDAGSYEFDTSNPNPPTGLAATVN
jgi:hypothetical protein